MKLRINRKTEYYLVSSLILLFAPVLSLVVFSGLTMSVLVRTLGKPQEIDAFSFIFAGGFVGILGFLLGLVISLLIIRTLAHRWSSELGEEKTKLTCLSFLTFLVLLVLLVIAISRF